MSPHSEQIFSLFNEIGNPWRDNGAYLDEILSLVEKASTPDVVFHVVGQEFQLAATVTGMQAVKDYVKGQVAPAFLGALDPTMPKQHEVSRVMGGGDSEWAAVEFKGKATSKNGKPWYNETLLLLRSNEEGKWVEVTAYMDTLHMQNHFSQASK